MHADAAPVILNPTGNNFIEWGINSASMLFKFLGWTKIAFDQKSEPKPIIISLAIKPMKILGTANIAKGSAILIGESWAFVIIGL